MEEYSVDLWNYINQMKQSQYKLYLIFIIKKKPVLKLI